MKKIIISAIVLLFTTGCVSNKNIPLDSASLKSSAPTQITLSKRELPAFIAQTAGKAAFGVVGALATISAGNKIVKDNEIEDPANYIGAQLAKVLAKKYGITEINRSENIVTGLKKQAVVDTYTGSGIVLDVRTHYWGFDFFVTKWNKYRVTYSAKFRLVDSDSGALLAEGVCDRSLKKYDEGAPTKVQLLANSAARLKEELSLAADTCVEQLKTDILQL